MADGVPYQVLPSDPGLAQLAGQNAATINPNWMVHEGIGNLNNYRPPDIAGTMLAAAKLGVDTGRQIGSDILNAPVAAAERQSALAKEKTIQAQQESAYNMTRDLQQLKDKDGNLLHLDYYLTKTDNGNVSFGPLPINNTVFGREGNFNPFLQPPKVTPPTNQQKSTQPNADFSTPLQDQPNAPVVNLPPPGATPLPRPAPPNPNVIPGTNLPSTLSPALPLNQQAPQNINQIMAPPPDQSRDINRLMATPPPYPGPLAPAGRAQTSAAPASAAAPAIAQAGPSAPQFNLGSSGLPTALAPSSQSLALNSTNPPPTSPIPNNAQQVQPNNGPPFTNDEILKYVRENVDTRYQHVAQETDPQTGLFTGRAIASGKNVAAQPFDPTTMFLHMQQVGFDPGRKPIEPTPLVNAALAAPPGATTGANGAAQLGQGITPGAGAASYPQIAQAAAAAGQDPQVAQNQAALNSGDPRAVSAAIANEGGPLTAQVGGRQPPTRRQAGQLPSGPAAAAQATPNQATIDQSTNNFITGLGGGPLAPGQTPPPGSTIVKRAMPVSTPPPTNLPQPSNGDVPNDDTFWDKTTGQTGPRLGILAQNPNNVLVVGEGPQTLSGQQSEQVDVTDPITGVVSHGVWREKGSGRLYVPQAQTPWSEDRYYWNGTHEVVENVISKTAWETMSKLITDKGVGFDPASMSREQFIAAYRKAASLVRGVDNPAFSDRMRKANDVMQTGTNLMAAIKAAGDQTDNDPTAIQARSSTQQWINQRKEGMYGPVTAMTNALPLPENIKQGVTKAMNPDIYQQHLRLAYDNFKDAIEKSGAPKQPDEEDYRIRTPGLMVRVPGQKQVLGIGDLGDKDFPDALRNYMARVFQQASYDVDVARAKNYDMSEKEGQKFVDYANLGHHSDDAPGATINNPVFIRDQKDFDQYKVQPGQEIYMINSEGKSYIKRGPPVQHHQ